MIKRILLPLTLLARIVGTVHLDIYCELPRTWNEKHPRLRGDFDSGITWAMFWSIKNAST